MSWIGTLVALLVLPGPGFAQQDQTPGTPEAGASREAKRRGSHLSLTLTGGELEAPRQTSTTDLELFSGLGLSVAGGYRIGWIRLEGEFHPHHSERGFTGDTVDVRSLMFNVYADFTFARRFAVFVGAGVGSAKIDVRIDTCLDLEGCPALSYVDASRSVSAFQYMIGVGWEPAPRRRLFVGYRRFSTGSLGLVDSTGRGFENDGADLPMALLGYTWSFGSAEN